MSYLPAKKQHHHHYSIFISSKWRNEIHQKTISSKKIFSFCTNILPEFHLIMKNLEELQHKLSSHDFAMNLMDLGRQQMSEVDDPEEQDVVFTTKYI
jgi:hypothetical protein